MLLHLTKPLHVLRHNLDGLARAVVGCHSVKHLSQDRRGTTCVPAFVLHAVAQRVQRQLPSCNDSHEALNHHGRGNIVAA